MREAILNSGALVDEEQDFYKINTVSVVSKMAYLIGVPDDFFLREPSSFDKKIYDELIESKEATIIRKLCKIRTAFLKKYNAINSHLTYSL